MQIVLGVALLLGVGIFLAFMFAPEKPPAPPTSKVTYRAESPKPKDQAPQDAVPLPDLPGMPKRPGAKQDPITTQTEEAKKEKPFKVTGLVIDQRTKQPIADALVTLRREWTPAEKRDWESRDAAAKVGNDQALSRQLREERNRLQQTERARTGADGRFEVGLDQPGQYEAEAVHRQYLASKSEAGAVNADKPNTELQLTLSNGATISGRVTEIGSATPAPDVKVVVENDGVHTATTDAKGNYQIAGLAPGEFGILVDTQGTAYKPGRTLPYQKVMVQSAAADVRNVDFQVEPAGVVWGYVMTPDKQPVKGAEVFLTSPQSLFSQAITAAIKQAPPVRGTSQEDGYYELLGVPINEEWRVYASSKAASPQLAEPFMLTSEVRSVQIDVYLYGGTDVHGVVVDSKNRPVAEANVACIPSYTKMLSPNETASAFRNAKSDQDGSFTIEKLPAGDYQILAQKKDYKIPTVGTAIYPDGMGPLDGITVQLLPVDEGNHYVAGTVTANGQPVSGANVKVEGFGSETMNSFGREGNTDGSGSFQINGLEAGMYRLRVTKEGYAPRTIPRVLLDTETRVNLDQSAVVRGVVLVQETKRPPDVPYRVVPTVLTEDGQVSLFGTSDLGDIGTTSFTNPDGSFELYLPPNSYRLEASAEGFANGRTAVALQAGQVQDGVQILLSQNGGSISGTVRIARNSSSGGSGDDSVTGTKVMLVEVGNVTNNQNTQTVDDTGAFTFSNLTEGSYYAIANNPNYANGTSRTVTLAAGDSQNGVDITLGSGGWIEGRVYHGGKPQAGVTVTAVSGDNRSTGNATTEADGSYRIDGLGTGTYTVTWIPTNSGSIGDLGNITALSCQVTDGQGTHLDFGVDGVTFTGQCVPGPIMFLFPLNFAMLQEVGAPPLAAPGQSLNVDVLTRAPALATVQVQSSGQFVFEKIPPGTYQLSIFYVYPGGGGGGNGGGPGGGGDLRLVGYQTVTVDGNPAPQPINCQLQ